MGKRPTFTPGMWTGFLFGYENEPEDLQALIIATSRHKRVLTPEEIATELSGFTEVRRVTWWASTKEHREGEFCECEQDGFCENGGGKGWLQAVLCVPVKSREVRSDG